MKKNLNARLIIVIVFVLVLIGVIIAFIIGSRKEEYQDEEIPDITLKGIVADHKCEVEIEDADDKTKTFIIENFEVDGDRILSSVTTSRIECSDKETFEKLKSENDYGNNVAYDDKQFIILYQVNDKLDYTKNEDGEDVTVSYEEYTIDMESLGSTCK